MSASQVLEEYMSSILAGRRAACRAIVQDQASKVADPRTLYFDLLWPAMERVEKLYRGDRINAATESMATCINRIVADQLQMHLKPEEPNGKKILITCAAGESEELGSQMCADLFEANGWDVYLLGGGIPNDEVLNLSGQLCPDILLIFGTQPAGVPGTRQLIGLIREIGANATMNIMVSGGVFNRADGLWKEVSADIYAKSAKESLSLADAAQPREPEPPRVGAPKKRRRRRRAPAMAAAE